MDDVEMFLHCFRSFKPLKRKIKHFQIFIINIKDSQLISVIGIIIYSEISPESPLRGVGQHNKFKNKINIKEQSFFSSPRRHVVLHMSV